MDWLTYRQRCDRPDTWTRWMLMQTRELLLRAAADDGVALLDAALAQAPLAKPSDHRGGQHTDMFELALRPEQVAAISAVVDVAIAAGWRTSGDRAKSLAGFAAAWREYLQWAKAAAS